MAISYFKLCYSLKKFLQPSVKGSNEFIKFYCTKSRKLYAEKLRSKCLIQVKGNDASSLLQGLITNDINNLVSDSKAIYSMFLNNRGRIMFDTMIVKKPDEEAYLIECDSTSAQTLEKHLKKYKLRKKVSIKVVEEEYSLYAVYDLSDIINLLPPELSSVISKDPKLKKYLYGSNGDLTLQDLDFGDFLAYRDPRLSALGYRVIIPSEHDISDVNNRLSDTEGLELHRLCRYWLGIVEGGEEIPYEKCFPLETNCDYLHGVSFQKGCYVGQELTARSHHTGVIRKRIMPLVFDTPFEDLPIDVTADSSEDSKKIGKLRGSLGKYAVALLRMNECFKLPHLHVGNNKALCFKPLWWPKETFKVSKSDVT